MNTALSIKRQAAQSHAKPIGTPKLTTGHFIALQRDSAPPTRTQTPAPLTRNLDKPLVEPHPQGETYTIKKNYKLSEGRKATPYTAI